MRRFRRPSTGTILGGLALFVALAGTAYAASTVVNIADPATPSNVAKVDANGRLQVGDTSGPLTVDGTVSTLQLPNTFVHGVGLAQSEDCVAVIKPPAGKALVVQTLRIDPYLNPSPSADDFINVFSDATCSGQSVASISPQATEMTTIPFQPGIGTRPGMSVKSIGDIDAALYADGYVVPTNSVPVTPAAKGAEPSARP